MYTLNIVDSDEEILKNLLPAMAKEIDKRIRLIVVNIRKECIDLTTNFLKKEKTYQALVEGPLDAEFGFNAGTKQSRVDNVINAIAEKINVVFLGIKVVGTSLDSRLYVNIVPDDISDIFQTKDAIVYNYSKKYPEGIQLPWLEWLLVRGSETVLVDFDINYQIEYGNFPKSRSGKAQMVPLKEGQLWRVPDDYAGTINDNWITRSIGKFNEQYEKGLSSIVEKNLKKVF